MPSNLLKRGINITQIGFIFLLIVLPIFNIQAQAISRIDVKDFKTITGNIEKGKSQEVIVILNDDQAYAKLKQKKKILGGASNYAIDLQEYRDEISRLQESVMSRLSHSHTSVIKKYTNLPASAIRISDKESLDRLLNSPEVKGVYPNRKFKPSLAESLPMINQPEVVDLGVRGNNTAVAVLDTGVDYTLPALGSCASPGDTPACRVVYAHDFTAVDDGQLDADGHGTTVAAIAAAVAPDTKILALDVFDGDYAKDSDILAAIDWVIQNQSAYNIVAANLSLGGFQLYHTQCTNSVYTDAFSRLRQEGIIPVTSSGNEGDKDGLDEPACAPGAVSVGAVYNAPFNYEGWETCTDTNASRGQVACFSNSADYLTLLAPGAEITAAGRTMSGTSMAAPFITGSVAVLRGEGGAPGDTLDETIAHMVNTGTPVVDAANGQTHPLINLEAAYFDGRPKPAPQISDFSPGSAGQGSTVTINGNGFLDVTAVNFGGTPAAKFTVQSTSKIVAVVGDGASGQVSVITSNGTASMGGFVFLPSLTGIHNNPSSAQISSLSGQLQLSVEGQYEDGTTADVTLAATFNSSNNNVAIVDSNGLIRPVNEGSAKIYSHENGFTGVTQITVNFTANKIFESEPNDTINSANPIADNQKIYEGKLDTADDVDIYKIDLTNPSLITALVRPLPVSNSGWIRATIIDSKGTVFISRVINSDSTHFINVSVVAHDIGTYYLKIEKYGDYPILTGDYEIILQIKNNPLGSGLRELEPNDSMADANKYSLQDSVIGQLSSTTDKDYFAYNLPSAGILLVGIQSVGNPSTFSKVTILDGSGFVLASKSMNASNTHIFPISLEVRINTPGTYYEEVTTVDGFYSSDDYSTGADLRTDESYDNLENEPDDTMGKTITYPLGTTLYGNNSSGRDVDYYGFDLSEGTFIVQLSSGVKEVLKPEILDNRGSVLPVRKTRTAFNTTLAARINTAGRYYVLITRADNTANSGMDYDFHTKLSSDTQLYYSLESEPNNSMGEAIPFYPDTSITGHIFSASDVDYYAIDLAPGVFSIQTKKVDDYATPDNITIMDGAGTVLGTADFGEIRNTDSYPKLTVDIKNNGRYYVRISCSSQALPYCGQNYEFIPKLDADTDGDGIPNSMDPDDDNDGLTNIQEEYLRTNPLNPDTDGDGVSDYDEYTSGRNPLVDERKVLMILDGLNGD